MSKTLIIILFLVGFFGGLAFGLAWGFSLTARHFESSMNEFAADHAEQAATLNEIKSAVTPAAVNP